MCREKLQAGETVNQFEGSPLRVQGKETAGDLLKAIERITPACAGKRTKKEYAPLRTKDHPCVCREK